MYSKMLAAMTVAVTFLLLAAPAFAAENDLLVPPGDGAVTVISVPEPASMATMLATGIAGFAVFRRTRRKK